MKILRTTGLVLAALILVYLMGPKPATPKYNNTLPEIPSAPAAVEEYVAKQEAKHKLKPDNQARIIWYNDSSKTMTEYAVVYLHGFSASQEEGDPVHIDFAKKIGANLYLSRLNAHGLDTTHPLASFTAEGVWNSAKEAYAIGKKLGKKVILMSTSTGGTVALKLCAEYPEITASLLFSPNIAINDSKAWMLNNPWGKQIAEAIVGKFRVIPDTTEAYAKYWDRKYVTYSVVQLQELLESTMKASLFERIKTPTLLLYYYKNDQEQDPVVKVSAMKRMFSQLGTPDSLKRQQALPNVGDHVIAGWIKSKDLNSVHLACEAFAKEILHIPTQSY
ncbi:MAG: alpha/beta hydrolase [Bacteroidetes bacterium]|nr:alpha/beta hydrolase [Bacteroidota bacterium]